MKTIRVFVSSPGDVQAERTIAERLIRTIAEELAIPVSVQYSNLLRDGEPVQPPNSSGEPESGELILCPYFWEYQRFSPELGYQDQIPSTAQFDLVISILWSRLGTKLHPRFQMPDGSEPRSGTEFEIAWAKAQHAKTPGVPALHVYRNRSQPNPPLDPPEKREEFFRQWDSLKGFFESWEKDSEGQFIGAFNNYNNLEEFERLFREHLRDFLSTQISSERNRQWLAQRSQVRRWKENPFRGLQIFDFEHALVFAGRTLAIDGVLGALTRQAEAGRPFVLVLGASGSGKSSLVRAGVLPLLVEPGVIEGIGLWRRSVMRPGAGGSQSDMFDALAAGLLAQEGLPELADLESTEPVKDLAAELRANPKGVADRVKDKLNQVASEYRLRQEQRLRELESGFRDQKREADAENARLQREKLEPPRARLALVVDQLEELFTSGFSEELQLKFINALSVLARSGRVFLLVTLRNDFYDRYQQFTDLVELAKPSGKYDLQPPTPQELGRMIRLPAQAAGLEFEHDEARGQTLDEALRDSAAADPQALPLLEHVLTRLYELQEKRGDRILSWSDYRMLGEMNGALANHAEEVFSTLGPHEQGAFPLVMRYLVTLGHGEEEVPNRRTAPYNDFLVLGAADHDPRAGAKGFVDRFIEKRLLVADTDPHGETTVSVAHEALLREWVRVKSWLAENREFLRMRDRLDSSLRLWLSRGKQKDDLLGPGLPVAEGERLVKEFETSLSREEIDYINVSTAERKRREQARARQFQVAAAVLFVLLCAASIGAYLGITGRTEAERQREFAQKQERDAVAAKVEAEKQKQGAVTANVNLEAKNRELGSMLEEAARSDRLSAQESFLRGEVAEALAYCARALRYEPNSSLPVEVALPGILSPPFQHSIVTFQGHTGVVMSAVFSPDGRRVLTGSWDKTARLWEADTGKLLTTFSGHTDGLLSAVFSPDGRWVLTGSEDSTARLWEADTGKLRTTFSGHTGWVYSVAFSPDGRRVLTASADKTARLWEADTGKLLTTFSGHTSWVLSAVFSPDGRRVLTGSGDLTASSDNTARLWEADTGKLLTTFSGHTGAVRGVAFSPDGRRVLTAAYDNTARLWEADTGKLLTTFSGHTAWVSGVAFSPDGRRVLTASADKTARLWEADTGKLLTTFSGHTAWVTTVAFSPEGRRVLTASEDNTARLWEADTGELLTTFSAHTGGATSVAFSPDSRRVLTAAYDNTARLWEADTGELLTTFSGHTGAVSSVAFGPDGRRVLTGSSDHTARLWEAGTGELLTTFSGHTGAVSSVAFGPDGRRVLTASSDHTARLWEAGTGKLLTTFSGHTDAVSSVAFGPDSRRVLTGSNDHTARLWEADTGELLTTFSGHTGWGGVTSVAFSPDGRRVLIGSNDNTEDKTAWLWEADTGKHLTTFHSSAVTSVAFSPDGRRVLTGSGDQTARLWEAATGELLTTFSGYTGWGGVTSVAFSPDGRRVLTASEDHTARLWVLLPSNVKPPDWSADFLVWLGGKQIGPDGKMEALPEADLQERLRRLRPHQNEDSDFACLLRWQLLPPEEQPVDPYRVTTRKQAADLIIRPDMSEPEALHAYELDPWHPLIHLALAGFEQDPIRADFLRRYSLDRLPNDPKLRQRASEFLHKQGKEDLAREVEARGQ